jgi:hypothetical protein
MGRRALNCRQFLSVSTLLFVFGLAHAPHCLPFGPKHFHSTSHHGAQTTIYLSCTGTLNACGVCLLEIVARLEGLPHDRRRFVNKLHCFKTGMIMQKK